MGNALISIIVPVHNVEEYLPRCLESIAAQSYEDFEAILVDDGSTDSSGAICDGFAARDPRFKVFHQENKWLSGARNTGLDNCSGEYICFVDGDDWLHPDYLSVLYDGFKTGCDLSMVGFEFVDEEGGAVLPPEPEDNSNAVFSREECLKGLILGIVRGDYTFGVVWNKMYPRDLVAGLRFGDFYSLEDAPFNLEVYSRVGSVRYDNSMLYCYLQRSGSIMNGKKDNLPKMAEGRMRAYKSMLDAAKGSAFTGNLMLRRVFSTNIMRYRTWTEGTEYERPVKGLFRQVWKENWREFITCRDIPLKTRLVIAAGWISPAFWNSYQKHKAPDAG
jgi:glycosyltransferase involved in cell wall biosynthesis